MRELHELSAASFILLCGIALFSVFDLAEAAPPKFDVERYCREIANVGESFSETTLQGCYQMEQEAYDTVKPAWESLPSTIRDYCVEIARAGGAGSYSTLQGCIQMELESKDSNKKFEFKY